MAVVPSARAHVGHGPSHALRRRRSSRRDHAKRCARHHARRRRPVRRRRVVGERGLHGQRHGVRLEVDRRHDGVAAACRRCHGCQRNHCIGDHAECRVHCQPGALRPRRNVPTARRSRDHRRIDQPGLGRAAGLPAAERRHVDLQRRLGALRLRALHRRTAVPESGSALHGGRPYDHGDTVSERRRRYQRARGSRHVIRRLGHGRHQRQFRDGWPQRVRPGQRGLSLRRGQRRLRHSLSDGRHVECKSRRLSRRQARHGRWRQHYCAER